MNTSPKLLEVSKLSKAFEQDGSTVSVLSDVSFSLNRESSLAIVGPSGCGKTTLLLLLAGLLKFDSGEILFNGSALTGSSSRIGLVLQNYGLLPWKTVSENIVLGAKLQKLNINNNAISRVKHTLGIEHLDRLYPEQLSGGQKQRVALARVFLLKPQLLLLDEPFSALDAITREKLQHFLMDEYRARKFGFIVVTHSIEEAVALGQRIMIFDPAKQNLNAVIDNPNVFTKGFRSSKIYFDLCYDVHKALLN